MSDKKIYGQLVALTKEVKLREPKDGSGRMAQFIAGKNDLYNFSGGIGITWWHTVKAFEICRNIASMAISKHQELQDGDIEELSNIVQNTLRQNCLNNSLFNGDDIFLSRKENLFESRSIDNVENFSKKLWEHIFENFKKSIMYWCTVYPIPRVKSSSFDLNYDGISLISRNDMNAWDAWIQENYYTEDWNPNTGSFLDGNKTIFSRLTYETLLVCKCSGTKISAKFSAKLKFKKFLSILFAIFSESTKNNLIKSDAEPFRACIQFPQREERVREGIIQSYIGELIPYFIRDYHIDDSVRELLQNWYRNRENSEDEKKNRSDKGAHFVNHAMNSDDIESYINYFIALDAIYGERGRVEKSIIDGIRECIGSDTWVSKIEWLFELRSELVHGGSRYIREWDKYERYRMHFKSLPPHDIEKLAFICLLHYFS